MLASSLLLSVPSLTCVPPWSSCRPPDQVAVVPFGKTRVKPSSVSLPPLRFNPPEADRLPPPVNVPPDQVKDPLTVAAAATDSEPPERLRLLTVAAWLRLTVPLLICTSSPVVGAAVAVAEP